MNSLMNVINSYQNQNQNITHVGSITISGSETFVIENVRFNITRSITVKDYSTLIIQNAEFISTPPNRVSIKMENRASLIVSYATIVFQPSHYDESYFLIEDEALVNITNSKFLLGNLSWGRICNSSEQFHSLYARLKYKRKKPYNFMELWSNN